MTDYQIRLRRSPAVGASCEVHTDGAAAAVGCDCYGAHIHQSHASVSVHSGHASSYAAAVAAPHTDGSSAVAADADVVAVDAVGAALSGHASDAHALRLGTDCAYSEINCNKHHMVT